MFAFLKNLFRKKPAPAKASPAQKSPVIGENVRPPKSTPTYRSPSPVYNSYNPVPPTQSNDNVDAILVGMMLNAAMSDSARAEAVQKREERIHAPAPEPTPEPTPVETKSHHEVSSNHNSPSSYDNYSSSSSSSRYSSDDYSSSSSSSWGGGSSSDYSSSSSSDSSSSWSSD